MRDGGEEAARHAGELLELELLEDLEALAEHFGDEEFSSDLYRALANNVWSKEGGPEGHVSLSWRRAEEIVNALRAGSLHEPLALAQTGGEGEVSPLVERELGRLGWRIRPLDTGRRDAEHQERPATPPPREQGERESPAEDSHAWERRAHEEAERHRKPTTPARPPGRRV